MNSAQNTSAPPGSGSRIVRFAGLTLAAAALLFILGYTPTVRLGGKAALGAMAAGILISMLASLLGSLPLLTLAPGTDPRTVPTRSLAAMLIRFVAILTLGLAVALSGWFPRAPFLIWVALSHLVFLIVDTLFALRAAQASSRPE